MVSKIIVSLIVLSSLTLFAHENINHITTNVNPFELNSAHLKLDHLSVLELPNEDKLLFNVAHTPSLRYFQNEIGVGYRKSLNRVGLGANLYYMHTNSHRALIHQISPGLELFYKDLQVTYNLYLPTAPKRTLKHGDLYHSILSEFGLRYTPRKDIGLGLLPSYDHFKKEWSVNSRISYILNERFEFAICPMYRPQGFSCSLSFGVIFSMNTPKRSKSTHRSNGFVLSYVKAPKIYVQLPKYVPIAIAEPIYVAPMPIPVQEEVVIVEEVKEEVAPIEEVIVPIEQPKQPEPFNWWKYIPFIDYKGTDVVKTETDKVSMPYSPLSANNSHIEDFYFLPPPQVIPEREEEENKNVAFSGPAIIDNYRSKEQRTTVIHYNPTIIEDYKNESNLG